MPPYRQYSRVDNGMTCHHTDSTGCDRYIQMLAIAIAIQMRRQVGTDVLHV